MSLDFWTGYWTFSAFVFGAVVGSFLNVCIWRLPRGESIWARPSHCPSCKHRLRMLPDMAPLVSQLWYRSRCRYCGARFSWRYFWVELITGCLFAGIYLRYVAFSGIPPSEFARTLSSGAAMVFVAALVVIFFIDLDHYEIHDHCVWVALAAAFARDAVLIWQGVRPLWQTIPGTPWSVPAPSSLLMAAVAFWLLWQFAALCTALLAREAMGAGDSLLLAAMGAFLVPWPLLAFAFLAAVALGTIGGIAGILAYRERSPAAAPPGGAITIAVAAPETPAEADGPQEEAAGGTMPPAANAAFGGTPVGRPGDEAAVAVLEAAEPEMPVLPMAGRIGRVMAVAGTWVAVLGLWAGLVLLNGNTGAGIAVLLGSAVLAPVLIVRGARLWVSGDREWLPAMDEFFEGDPGPKVIPFGPYLVAGTVLAMFAGRQVVEWYAQGVMGMALGTGWD